MLRMKPFTPKPAQTTFACVGNGGSLSKDDAALLDRDDVTVIAINDAYKFTPWAAYLYAADFRWWAANYDEVILSKFTGKLLTIDPSAAATFSGLKLLDCEDLHAPMKGISDNKQVLRHGYSGGFQALQLARMLGAKRVLLLGYDYGATGQSHGAPTKFADSWSDHALMREAFSLEVATKLKHEGMEIINCTRATAIGVFKHARLEEALAAQ